MAANWKERLFRLDTSRSQSALQVKTLGTFEALIDDRIIKGKGWGREKTIQLFQFLLTNRSRSGMRKEQIIDRLWDGMSSEEGDRDFKVALHGIHKVLEPNRPPRTDPKFISRQGSSYQVNLDEIWLDVQAFEDYVIIGNESIQSAPDLAKEAYRRALALDGGSYLPNQIYEDWTSEERERIQVMVLSAYISLAELELSSNPLETVRLTQKALSIDKTWEDAYQLEMKAFLAKGNRPAAIESYHRCVKVLDAEFGLDPLPETQKIYDSIT